MSSVERISLSWHLKRLQMKTSEKTRVELNYDYQPRFRHARRHYILSTMSKE